MRDLTTDPAILAWIDSAGGTIAAFDAAAMSFARRLRRDQSLGVIPFDLGQSAGGTTPDTLWLRVATDDVQGLASGVEPGSQAVRVLWRSLSAFVALELGQYSFESMMRARLCVVQDRSEAQGARQSLLLRIEHPVGQPAVSSILARIHGLTNEEANEVILKEVGLGVLLWAVADAEGQAYALQGIGDYWPHGSVMWHVVEADASATFSFAENSAKPMARLDDVVVFGFARLTDLVRLLTREHDLQTALQRGTVTIGGSPAGLAALARLTLA